MNFITSKDNPLVKRWKRLAQQNSAAYELGTVWLEGDHLCAAALDRGWQPLTVVVAEHTSVTASVLARAGSAHHVEVPPSLLTHISGMGSGPAMAMELAMPRPTELEPQAATVVLDRVQDPGNVGSILRTASAMGFTQVVAMTGTAAMWSPKVLRSGMGAHFNLRLLENRSPDDLAHLRVPLYATSSHQGTWLHQTPLVKPMGWLLGHEGQGVSPACEAHAQHWVRIPQPGGEESLNVAAAAAICLHASAVAQL